MKILSTVALTYALWSHDAAGQVMAMDTMSLHRLPGVFVEIGAVPEVARADGFDADSVSSLIVDKLTSAKIRVLSQEEWQVTLGSPVLHVRFNLLKASEFLYLYSVEVELRQLAAMMRDSQPTFAPTWRSGVSMGTVPTSRLGSLAGVILSATDRFISVHAVANRRRRPY